MKVPQLNLFSPSRQRQFQSNDFSRRAHHLSQVQALRAEALRDYLKSQQRLLQSKNPNTLYSTGFGLARTQSSDVRFKVPMSTTPEFYKKTLEIRPGSPPCRCSPYCNCSEYTPPTFFHSPTNYLTSNTFFKLSVQKLREMNSGREKENSDGIQMKYKMYLPSPEEMCDHYPKTNINKQHPVELKMKSPGKSQQGKKFDEKNNPDETQRILQLIKSKRQGTVSENTPKQVTAQSPIQPKLSNFAIATNTQRSGPQNSDLLNNLSAHSQASEVMFSVLPNSPSINSSRFPSVPIIIQQQSQISAIEDFHDKDIVDAAKGVMKYYNITVENPIELAAVKQLMWEVSQQSNAKLDKQQIIMNRIREWHETKIATTTTTTTYPQKVIDNSSNLSERQAAFNRKLQKVYNDIEGYDQKLQEKMADNKSVRLDSLVQLKSQNDQLSRKMMSDMDNLLSRTQQPQGQIIDFRQMDYFQ